MWQTISHPGTQDHPRSVPGSFNQCSHSRLNPREACGRHSSKACRMTTGARSRGDSVATVFACQLLRHAPIRSEYLRLSTDQAPCRRFGDLSQKHHFSLLHGLFATPAHLQWHLYSVIQDTGNLDCIRVTISLENREIKGFM